MSNYQSQTEVANSVHFDTTFTNEYGANQTGASLITPTTSTRLAIKGVYIGTVATSGEARLHIDSNSVAIFYGNSQPGYIPVNIKGLVNSSLKITSTFGDNKYFILVNYREE